MRAFVPGIVFALVIGAVQAQTQTSPAPPSTAAITELPAVSVSGVQPGPGLWKVSRGEHVLWVLGTISNLPAHVQWRSDEVAQAVAGAQELIQSPRVKLKLDTGFFGKLFLLPSAYAARKNPDGKTLQEVLPAPLYARWTVLKAKYIGRDGGIERWRPIFAAMELYRRALKQSGLRGSGQVVDAVEAVARQHGVPITPVVYTLEIERPRAALDAFKSAGPDDIECFARTLDSIEHDLPANAERANAWSTGDIATLRALPDSRYRDACAVAISDSGFARTLGIDDVPARVQAAWLAAARHALDTERSSFAVLPMDEVLDADGNLALLKAAGYAVEAPDAEDTAPAAAASSSSTSTP
jgi:hypothetical protein